MATTTSVDFPLATEHPFPGIEPDSSVDGNIAGASGASTGTLTLPRGGLIAIIVIVCIIGLIGIASTILFFIAKKREWTMRETIRRSTKKVVNALTPRRSEFPRSVKDSTGQGSKMNRLDDIPPTPRFKPSDLEKGLESRSDSRGSDRRTNFSRK